MNKQTYFLPVNRYYFDNKLHVADGWSQIDTAQDAYYFGIWANPITLEYFSYAEGDCTEIAFGNNEEFISYIKYTKQWSVEAGYGFQIDGMCNELIINCWKSLGFERDLH